MAVRPVYVLAGAGLAAAAAIAYTATRSAGPVRLPAFTETRAAGPLMEHLVSAEELHTAPVTVQHRYPGRVCPGITALISHGFSPLHAIPDPQVAALPAETAW